MVQKLAEKPTKTVTLPDRGEALSTMEPMVVSESSRHRGRLNELVFNLTAAATAFKASLPEGMVQAVGDLVRSMNCYYSNLIEGHNTHPIDIERALAEEEQVGALTPHSTRVLAHILAHRQLERKDVREVAGFDERKSRRVTAMLHKRGIIVAPTHRAPFRIAFPAALAPRLMPGLYPRLPTPS